MSITTVLIVVGVLAAFLLFKRMGQISSKAARAHLLKGALIVDVRSNAEFQAHHLPYALHIPLEELETLIARRVRDKNQVLLLHCQSGMRSQTARRKLVHLGYAHAFNLGSYSRAERIVGHR
ncbi:MAG TPA: rhodanese-like domain-containing protein [Terracidiphilus sp.]|jgi:phage shock protein E